MFIPRMLVKCIILIVGGFSDVMDNIPVMLSCPQQATNTVQVGPILFNTVHPSDVHCCLFQSPTNQYQLVMPNFQHLASNFVQSDHTGLLPAWCDVLSKPF